MNIDKKIEWKEFKFSEHKAKTNVVILGNKNENHSNIFLNKIRQETDYKIKCIDSKDLDDYKYKELYWNSIHHHTMVIVSSKFPIHEKHKSLTDLFIHENYSTKYIVLMTDNTRLSNRKTISDIVLGHQHAENQIFENSVNLQVQNFIGHSGLFKIITSYFWDIQFLING